MKLFSKFILVAKKILKIFFQFLMSWIKIKHAHCIHHVSTLEDNLIIKPEIIVFGDNRFTNDNLNKYYSKIRDKERKNFTNAILQ